MESRNLPGTDLHVSRVCLGSMTFGGQADEAEAERIVACGLDAGIDFVDTANVYNAGQSEVILGRLLGRRRQELVLATKVCHRMGDGADEAGLSRRAIFRAAEDSLRRLKTDHIDIYYLHQPDYDVPVEESLEAMGRLIQEGKVRFVGASNYASWQACRMLWLAEQSGLPRARVMQPMYNLLARGIEQEFLPMCRAFDLATVVYNPLAGGLLTGKHHSTTPLPGSRFEQNPGYRDRYWHSANFEAVRELGAIARVAGRSLIGLAFGWLLHHTPCHSVIIGASRLDQLEANIEALAEGPLPRDVVAACDTVWEQLRGVSPTYNR